MHNLKELYEYNLERIEGYLIDLERLLNTKNKDELVFFLEPWTHKRLWIAKYFDEKLIRKRLILSHHKHLLIGDYLIDDRRFNGASEFQGIWLKFGSEEIPDWKAVLSHIV